MGHINCLWPGNRRESRATARGCARSRYQFLGFQGHVGGHRGDDADRPADTGSCKMGFVQWRSVSSSNSLAAVTRFANRHSFLLPPFRYNLQFTQPGHHRRTTTLTRLKSSTSRPQPNEALSAPLLQQSPLCFSHNRPGRIIPPGDKLPVISLVPATHLHHYHAVPR